MSEKKLSLKERLKPASDGLYSHPSLLLPKMEEAAAWPLKELLDEDTLDSLDRTRMTLGIRDPFITYQDLVNLLIKYWQYPTRPFSFGRFSTVEKYSDFMYDLIRETALCYYNEMRRRTNSNGYVFVENASNFPGFSIPLPRLFQAGSLRCGNKKLSERLSCAYRDEFMALLEKNPELEDEVEWALKDQPESFYFYDPATMTYAAAYACEHDYISTERSYEYYFDAFILPYQIGPLSDESGLVKGKYSKASKEKKEDRPKTDSHHKDDTSEQFYIEDGTEKPIANIFRLGMLINELLRTDYNQKWTNKETEQDWIWFYPFTDTPYPFNSTPEGLPREERREALYDIINIILYGDMDAELQESDVEDHLFTFSGYAVDEDGNDVDYSFKTGDLQELVNAFRNNSDANLVALICHKDEADKVEHIHGLFYYCSEEPMPGMNRMEEIFSYRY